MAPLYGKASQIKNKQNMGNGCCQHLKLSTFRIHKLSGLCHPKLSIFGDYFLTIHPSIKPNERQQFLLSQGGA
jgi:hypothetical protein